MAQAQKGYFNENRQFITNSLSAIPINKPVFIVYDDETLEAKTTSQQQMEAMMELQAALSKIDDEPLDEEFDRIIAQGIRIRGVDL